MEVTISINVISLIIILSVLFGAWFHSFCTNLGEKHGRESALKIIESIKKSNE